MKYTLQVNDPKTGWAHAVDIEVQSPADAYSEIKKQLAKSKRLQFGLTVQPDPKSGKLFTYKDGEFVGTSDNSPLWLYLTQFGVSAE